MTDFYIWVPVEGGKLTIDAAPAESPLGEPAWTSRFDTQSDALEALGLALEQGRRFVWLCAEERPA